MNKPIVIVGLGEMGGVFARGLLRAGHPVYPVTRRQPMAQVAETLAEPAMVLIAVGEKDLQTCLQDIPDAWRDRIALLQNELLPADWSGIPDPTVISVWFEKKPGMEAKQIIPSPVFGPHAALIDVGLRSIGLDARMLQDADELLFELVVKNLYILTSNIAGLRTGGTVEELWRDHRDFARAVAMDAIKLQQALCGQSFDAQRLIDAMVNAFEHDPAHKCMGRSAPARLARALEHGQRLGIDLPTFQRIASETAES